MPTALAPAAARSLAIWHEMAAAKSLDRLASISTDDVLFRSPAFFKPYKGKQALQIVLSNVLTVFEDFAYHRTLSTADGHSIVLEFSARIGATELKGIDLIRFNSDGKIAEFEVMIRPMNALMALGKLMAERAGPALKALGDPDRA
jgi:ketosteroid isomerase-like protein